MPQFFRINILRCVLLASPTETFWLIRGKVVRAKGVQEKKGAVGSVMFYQPCFEQGFPKMNPGKEVQFFGELRSRRAQQPGSTGKNVERASGSTGFWRKRSSSNKVLLFSSNAGFNWISSIWVKCRYWQDTLALEGPRDPHYIGVVPY